MNASICVKKSLMKSFTKKQCEFTEVPKPQELLNVLNEYVIGQDRAKRTLAVAVYNHYKRVNVETTAEDVELQKAIFA